MVENDRIFLKFLLFCHVNEEIQLKMEQENSKNMLFLIFPLWISLFERAGISKNILSFFTLSLYIRFATNYTHIFFIALFFHFQSIVHSNKISSCLQQKISKICATCPQIDKLIYYLNSGLMYVTSFTEIVDLFLKYTDSSHIMIF